MMKFGLVLPILVQVWDYDNDLLRELVFMDPVADCLFLTDFGIILVAVAGTIL
jgi:hypothetical protein